MKKMLSALLFSTALSGVAAAQSSPGLVYGQVPSAAQWNGYFQQKQDVVAIPGNSVLGNGTASLVSGQNYLAMPSCSGSNAGLQWTTNSGFGCASYTFPSATLPTGDIYIGGLTNVATAQAVSGDATLAYTGALTVGSIGGKAVSLGGPLTFSGAFATTFTVGTTTNLTLPASGTVTALGNSVTGSGGVLVEQTSPSLVTPALGVATGTSLALGGATLGSNALAVTGSISTNGTLFSAGLDVEANSGVVTSVLKNTATGNVIYGGSYNQLNIAADGVIAEIIAVGGGGYLYGGAHSVNIINNSTDGPLVFSTNSAEKARIDAAGHILLGFTADQGGGQRLQVNGGAYISGNLTLGPSPTLAATSGNISLSNPVVTNGYTVSGLPAGIKGARAHVTDATSCTFGGTLTGGGSTYCPVTYNGSAWVGG